MPDNKKDASLRKRNQIARSNRMMFVWVAGVSVVVGFAVVISIFLFQRILFTEKVLAEKQNTASTLSQNIANVPELEAQIRVLDSNEALMSAKANEDDRALQVVLDALPSDANSLALGASLQQKLLSGIGGLTIQTLQVDPVVGVETSDNGAVEDASPSTTTGQITFEFSVLGSIDALHQVLENLEKSIRAIDVSKVTVQQQNGQITMIVAGRAFYEPAKTVELKDKVVES